MFRKRETGEGQTVTVGVVPRADSKAGLDMWRLCTAPLIASQLSTVKEGK